MSAFIGDLPSTEVETFPQLEEVLQEYNEILENLANDVLTNRDGYYATIEVNNGNTPKLVTKTTKHTCIDFVLINQALSSKLPNTELRNGDTYMFADAYSSASTYNATILGNSNLINGIEQDLVIDQNKGWVLLEYINESIGFQIIGSNMAKYTPSLKVNNIVDGDMDGTNQDFTLEFPVIPGHAEIIHCSGAIYKPTDFTITGMSLHFVTAPSSDMDYDDFNIFAYR